jgi:hypothetical protein
MIRPSLQKVQLGIKITTPFLEPKNAHPSLRKTINKMVFHGQAHRQIFRIFGTSREVFGNFSLNT